MLQDLDSILELNSAQIEQNFKAIIEKYPVTLGERGRIFIGGTSLNVLNIKKFLTVGFIWADEFQLTWLCGHLVKKLKEYAIESPKTSKQWNFFDKFTIVNGKPCYCGIAFKPYLKYIESIFRSEGQPLNALKIDQIKEKIKELLKEQV